MTSWTAKQVLDSVEAWATGAYLLVRENGTIPAVGRFDGLLFPVSGGAHCMQQTGADFFARPQLLGVEVKVSLPDFLRGLHEGQFARYDQVLNGLYLAVPEGLAVLNRIDHKYGVLVARPDGMATCLRHPAYHPASYSPEVPWRLIFHLYHRLCEARRLRSPRPPVEHRGSAPEEPPRLKVRPRLSPSLLD